ncbi:MAG: DNA polymerase III subunit gamma/tau [Sphaerochaeta sp.]
MSQYEVTATKKRPQEFSTLVGQPFVVSTIEGAIAQGRIAHAYLFSGPRGVGKTSAARILARSLNCDEGPTTKPCGVCSHCIEIKAGNSVDVIEIDGASNTGVNDIRQIKDEVLFPPQTGRYKIYIIDEVHMLSISAFNALLKTLEEPPPYVIFILATTELQKVPATIRSRCQQFHFQLIGLDLIKESLAQAAVDQGIQADDDALFWIAREATGSMRDAYTLFDQVVAFSAGHITMETIQSKLGLVGFDRIITIATDLLEGNTQTALLAMHSLINAGVSVEQTIKDLAQFYRSLLFMRSQITDEAILGVQSDRVPLALRTAYSTEQLEAALELLLATYREIRYSLNPRIELELAVSRLGELKSLRSNTALVKEIATLREELLSGNVHVTRKVQAALLRSASQAAGTYSRAPAPPPSRPSRTLTMEDLPELTRRLGDAPMLARVLGTVKELNQNDRTLTFTFNTAFAATTAKENSERLVKAIEELTGPGVDVYCINGETSKASEESPFGEDPVLRNIATVFRGDVLTRKSQ